MAESVVRARVLIDSALPQLDHLFDYAVPEHLLPLARPGVRVTVPLRNALAQGYLVELGSDESFIGSLMPLESVVSSIPVLDSAVYRLARRIADRSAGSASDVLRLAIPKRQVRVEKAELASMDAGERAEETSRIPADAMPSSPVPSLSLGPAAPSVESTIEPGRLSGYAENTAELLREGSRLALSAIARLAELPGAGETGGFAGAGQHPDQAGEQSRGEALWVGHWAFTLAEAAGQVTRSGRSVIIAVPDYRDLDQLVAAVRAHNPGIGVARMDGRQSGPDRYRAFLDALTGRARIVIGNRSALYAPAHNLGLIALWDDGDPLLAEPLAPYAHARDVALIRQEQQGCALVIAGHSRSTEVQRLVEIGHLRSISPAPQYRPRVVLAERMIDEQQGRRIPSSVWQGTSEALREGPVLVQVARPVTKGGDINIDAAVSDAAENAATAAPGAPDVQRTAHELGRAFPEVSVVQSHGGRPLQRLPETPALVVSTRGAEPIVPHGYRAVLLLDARRMLSRESLRVAEDSMRWWSNAAALAAPRAPVYLVGVDGNIGEHLATWRQQDFAAAELAGRRALRFPPATRLVVIEGSATEVSGVLDEVRGELAAEVHWPSPIEGGSGDGRVRAALRFDYRYGVQVAQLLRAAVLRNASGRRPGGRRGPVLRVRFDDRDFFDT